MKHLTQIGDSTMKTSFLSSAVIALFTASAAFAIASTFTPAKAMERDIYIPVAANVTSNHENLGDTVYFKSYTPAMSARGERFYAGKDY
jgi:hypothetical protein